jgi:DNA-binding XRE family transcriptional regulator
MGRHAKEPVNARDLVDALPPQRRSKIQARTQALIADEVGLAQLRKARKCSQAELAKELGIKQAEVSRLERRADMYVISLRKYVMAMGGELQIIAKFPDKPAVEIKQFSKIKAH